MSDIKHKVLVLCSGSITNNFAATNLAEVQMKLVEKELIPMDVSEELDAFHTRQDKANKIFRALANSVKARPSKFKQLLELLEENDMPDLSQKLRGKLSMLKLKDT